MMAWIDLLIVLLLPLTALITVLQKKPYAALISRGIMGSVAVLLYAALGAPDVALTEALVGTLLTVILYAVTVRSTEVLRLGMLSGQADLPAENPIRCFCVRYGLVLRKKDYRTVRELGTALKEGHIDVVLAEPGLLPALVGALPAGIPADRCIAVVAEHGRWHERRMNEQFGRKTPVFRIRPTSMETDG